MYRIIIVGDQEVGKTTIVRAYLNEYLCSEYTPTKESQIYDIPSKPGKGQIMIADYAGESNRESRQYAYKIADVVLVCFSLDCPDSFGNARTKWVPEVSSHS